MDPFPPAERGPAATSAAGFPLLLPLLRPKPSTPILAPAPASMGPGMLALPAAVALGISLAVRGPRRSLRLLAASLVTATAGEVLGVRMGRVLRHHTRPQVAGVPLLLSLGWYAFLAPAYGLAQAAVGHRGGRSVAAATALLATATDLANDPWGLASGFWEWREGGAYLRDVVGPNGVGGVPPANYAGWLAIAGTVALLCEPHRPPGEGPAARRHRTLLVAGYVPLGLGGLLWALRTGRLRLLALAGAAVYGGAAWAWLAAGSRV